MRFKGNIWAAKLDEIKSLSSKNKSVIYLLCVIDVFTKYAWVTPSKHKKDETVLNALINIVKEFNHKPNKFYSKLMQYWLKKYWSFLYSTYKEDKSVIVERLINISKASFCKKWWLMIQILNSNLKLVI